MTLKEYRKRKDLTLEQFAKLIGVKSKSTIHGYENGRVPPKVIMAKIKEVTKNWVKEGDFYND